MKRVLYSFFALLLGTLIWISSYAEALELDFQPRLEGGISYYAFESEALNVTYLSLPVNLNSGTNIGQASFEISDYLPFITYGGTLFLDRFYLDFTGQQSANGQDSTSTVLAGYVYVDLDWENEYINTAFFEDERVDEARFDRNEMAVSLGYAINKRCNVYAGYKRAVTEFNTIYQTFSTFRNYEKNPRYDYCSAKKWGKSDFSFEYEGPFIGGIYGWEIDYGRIFNGVLTANLALARLNGKVKLDHREVYVSVSEIDGQTVPKPIIASIEGGGSSPRYDTKGKTLGATMGLAWRGLTPIEGLSYFLGVTGYRYEFDAENNGQSDINETAVFYKVGISYLF